MESILTEIIEIRLSEMTQDENGYYKLNDILKDGRKLGHIIESDMFKNLITLLSRMLKEPSLISKKGRYGGTWAHKDIAIAFIMNINNFPNYTFDSNEKVFTRIIEKVFGGTLTIVKQQQFGKFFTDIYIKQLNLVIEFDEEYHYKEEQQKKDIERDLYLTKEHKVTILRFDKKNDDIYNLLGVIAKGMQEHTKNTMRLINAFT
jgi:very-short-patch-repair endonuclease